MWDQTASNFLVYNLQLPQKRDHWDFQACHMGGCLATTSFANYHRQVRPETRYSPSHWHNLQLSCVQQGCTNCCSLAAGLRGNEERMRKWRGNGERMRKWRENEEIHSQDFLILCLFPPSLSISYIKNCHILSQNVKYGTFVANVTKNLTYALWGNNSGSNSLRGSSASCAGLTNKEYFSYDSQILN